MNKYTAGAATILKVFFGALIGLMLTNGAGVLEMDSWSDWKPYVSAGIAAVLVFFYNYLNPTDPRYGVGA